ncbi:MAG: hypothetical protein RSC68_35340, partial [Acinetobacter sp.]
QFCNKKYQFTAKESLDLFGEHLS